MSVISTTTLHSLIDSSALFILSFIYSTKFIFHFSYFDKCEVMSYYGFHLHFPLSMFLFAICIPSSVKCLCVSFAHFLIGLFVGFVVAEF